MTTIDTASATFLIDVAKELLKLEKQNYYTDLYITEVRFALGGEDVPIRLVSNDAEGLSISVDGPS